ncbi:MAG: DUF2304 family protein [Gemmatimonadales bacterium]
MLRSQIVLIGLMVLYAVYVLWLRSTLRDRIIYLSLAVVGGILVIRPDWSNWLAAKLTIGRGADLVLYLFVVFSLFHFATTAVRLRRMQADLGTLARSLALLSAQGSPSQDDPSR